MSFFLHEARYRDLAPADRLVTICGAGALGANLAETLARMGLRHLRVIDHDRIEAHNLSTQPWVQQDVGGLKARVLANMLYRAIGARVEAQSTTLITNNAGALLSAAPSWSMRSTTFRRALRWALPPEQLASRACISRSAVPAITAAAYGIAHIYRSWMRAVLRARSQHCPPATIR